VTQRRKAWRRRKYLKAITSTHAPGCAARASHDPAPGRVRACGTGSISTSAFPRNPAIGALGLSAPAACHNTAASTTCCSSAAFAVGINHPKNATSGANFDVFRVQFCPDPEKWVAAVSGGVTGIPVIGGLKFMVTRGEGGRFVQPFRSNGTIRPDQPVHPFPPTSRSFPWFSPNFEPKPTSFDHGIAAESARFQGVIANFRRTLSGSLPVRSDHTPLVRCYWDHAEAIGSNRFAVTMRHYSPPNLRARQVFSIFRKKVLTRF
jgi:hypothetical protein